MHGGKMRSVSVGASEVRCVDSVVASRDRPGSIAAMSFRFAPPIFASLAILLAEPAHADTRALLKKPDAWFASEEAKTVAANILSYQSDYGGWPKNLDLAEKPFAGKPGDLVNEFKPIFDNAATTAETRFMARMFRATQDARYRESVAKAIDYILIAQYPTGGWPQIYPPDRQYHRHITFNDDTMVRILQLLREVAEPGVFDFVDADRRQAARVAFERGIECIVKCQVTVNGKLTAWCAQHDEITLVLQSARLFELASLSGAESVGIVRLLMSLDRPAPEVVRAIEAAVAWFESARIEGWRVKKADEKWEAIEDAKAGPLWARFYDLKTGEPLFADPQGKPHLGMKNIGAGRLGYDWTGNWPQKLFEKDLPVWKKKIAGSDRGPALVSWQPKVKIALAGDSTVTDSAGWGFGFKKSLSREALCQNFAQGGQSSKSFRDTRWWERTLAAKPAYVLIQFGHNDMPGKGPNRETDPATTYAENLARFVAEARAAGAKPVIVTSLARRIFEPDGKLRGELAPYADAARKVAAEQNVPLVDLFARSLALVEKLGPAGVEPFEPKVVRQPAPAPVSPAATATPKPKSADIDAPAAIAQASRDGTHLNARGSIEFGKIVAEELRRVVPELAPMLP